MYRFKSDNFGAFNLNEGAIVHLTDEVRAQLDSWFGPSWLGLFETYAAELTAHHSGCTGRHHNPLTVPPYSHSRPQMPVVEKLASAVANCRVLAQVNLGRALGPCWAPGTIVADPHRILLADGKVLPADTVAAPLLDRDAWPAGGIAEISYGGTPWLRGKHGVVRLRPFVGALATLAELALDGHRDVAIEQGAGKWAIVELA